MRTKGCAVVSWEVSFYNKRNGQEVTVIEAFGHSASKDDIEAVNEEVAQYLRDHQWLSQNTEKRTGEPRKIEYETVAVQSCDVRFEVTYIEE